MTTTVDLRVHDEKDALDVSQDPFSSTSTSTVYILWGKVGTVGTGGREGGMDPGEESRVVPGVSLGDAPTGDEQTVGRGVVDGSARGGEDDGEGYVTGGLGVGHTVTLPHTVGGPVDLTFPLISRSGGRFFLLLGDHLSPDPLS